MYLLIVGANELTLDGYYKPSCFSEDRAWPSMLFYRYLVLDVHRWVSGVGFCSSTLLFFLMSPWCFNFVVAEDHI